MDYSINFPNLGIHLEHVGKNIMISNFSLAYYGMVIAVGMMLGMNNLDIRSTVGSSDAFILPLPVSKDGLTLNAPLSDSVIQLDELFDMIEVFISAVGIRLSF